MRAELLTIQPVLESNRADTAAMLASIQTKQAAVDATRLNTEAEEAVCMEKAVEAQHIKQECEMELSAALPALNDAIEALKTLTKGDIAVVRAMLKPPQGVRLVVEAVAIMLRVKPVRGVDADGSERPNYWEPAKKELLGDPQFLKRLVTFKKEKITDAMLGELKVILALLLNLLQPSMSPAYLAICVCCVRSPILTTHRSPPRMYLERHQQQLGYAVGSWQL